MTPTAPTLHCASPHRPVIATAVDRHALIPLAAMLRSLQLNSPLVDVAVLAVGLSANDELRIKEMWRSAPSLRIVRIDPQLLENAPVRSRHLTRTAYARLFLAEMLPDCDRVIWLDADTIVLADLSPLWQADMRSALIAAVPDDFISEEELAATGTKLGTYFNSGVMVVNLALWRLNKLGDAARALMHEPHLICEDQSVLNRLSRGRVNLLDRRWNFHASRFHEYDVMLRPHCPCIVHFCGQVKPWHERVPFQGLFLDFLPADLRPAVDAAMPTLPFLRRTELARRRMTGLILCRKKHWCALIQQTKLAWTAAALRLSLSERDSAGGGGNLSVSQRPAAMTRSKYFFARSCLIAASKLPFNRRRSGVSRFVTSRLCSISDPPSR